MERRTVDVAGVPVSYLSCRGPGRTCLIATARHLLEPGMAAGPRRSGRRRTTARRCGFPWIWPVRRRADCRKCLDSRLGGLAAAFLAALRIDGPVGLAGHDIGGGVAQQVLVDGEIEVSKFALVNAVMFDSWPVPGVARFRDPAVAAATTTDDVLTARRKSVLTALARPAAESEVEEYLEPWTDPRVARSWLAFAGAADSRYTMELLPRLRASQTPKLLVWGEDDSFQLVEHAKRFAKEIPNTQLVRIPKAGHIPMENDAVAVARALAGFFI